MTEKVNTGVGSRIARIDRIVMNTRAYIDCLLIVERDMSSATSADTQI
jgi:hypothetical protein